MTATIASFIQHVTEQLGTSEDPMGSNHTKYGIEFGWDRVAWCAEFGWDVYHDVGIALPIKSASVDQIARWAVSNGYAIPSVQAVPGDAILRTWTGKQMNQSGYDAQQTHYQTLVNKQGSTGYLIGGNQGPGVVSRDEVTLGDSTILMAVAWSRLFDKPAPAPSSDNKGVNTHDKSHLYPKEVVGEGSRGNAVTFIQRFVCPNHVTGFFDDETKTAVLHRQHGLKLDYENGIVGPTTWAAFVHSGMSTTY